MINNRDCFFYKKSDFINRLQDLSPDSVCYIADTQQIYTHGRYFECNVTQDIVEQLIQNHGYLTPADLPVLTGGASPTPDEYVTGVSVGGHNINVQKGKLSEINVGSASKLETPRKIELSGDLSGSTMFDGSQDVNIETIVHNSTTADRLTTPRTISLSSQATGQVSFDGSGNIDIPVTVNELDSKNANNRDLNSLVTLNGYGGNLFYGMGGNTSTNRPSGVDWFGLFSFKSASGNYTTQILGSNNRLYSRSNADTSLGSWNTIAYLTDNVASATKLQNTRTFTISDGTNSGAASNFDGTGNVTLRLPRTINANIVGNVTGDIVGDITGDLHGNADTATKLQTGRNINGTLFDGTKNITTAQWGTARNLTIGNSTKSVNGSANVSWTLSEIGAVNKAGDTMTGTLNMQAGINLAEADGESWHLHGIFATNDWWDIAGYSTAKDDGYLDIRTGDNGDEGIRVSQWDSSKLVREAWLLNSDGNTQFPGTVTAREFRGTLSGNASTASKLATARTISLTGDASGSASFDGSANISIPVTIANDSHTHATSASSNATTNLTITAGGTTATVADLYATYADQLRTARTISLTGDVTGSTSFNGTGNVSIAATVANNSHTHTFANITDKPISREWSQGNNNNITTAQFLDLLEDAGAFKYGWFHARGLWSYGSTSNITDTGYGTLDLAGCAITVWGITKTKCTILVIPPLDRSVSSSVALGNIYLYINNGEGYTSGWRKIARFEDIDWNNITNKPSSFTPSSHTHPLSQISNLNAGWDSLLVNAPSAYLTRWPSISEVTGKQNFVLKLNGGTTEGSNQFTYNGTVAKSVNITPSGIGAAAASHSHSYLPLSGGTITGQLNGRGANFNTGDGATPFVISRVGLKKESVAISVDDTVARFDVTNDETSASLRFSLSATDTESGGGAAAKTGYVNDILDSGTIYTRYGYGDSQRFRIGWNPNNGAYIENFTAGKWISITDTGSLLYNRDKIWHSGNDGSGSGLDADLLDGYHADGLSRLLSYNPRVNITDAGWYRVYSLGNITDAAGSNVILHLKRNFSYWDNEAYTFAITIAYNGGISITQLSGRANSRLIDKIRVVYLKNTSNSVFIDFHVSITTQGNDYSVSGQGVGTFQSPAPVTETPANSVEFNTVNGVGSNLGFTGNLTGNATTATNATNLAGVVGTKYLYHLRRTGYNIDTESTLNPRVLEINNPEGTPPTSNAWLQVLVWGSGNSGYGTQLANQYNVEGNLYFRNKVAGTWKPWRTLIDNSNYTDYTVTKTGGGASGTWNINISGAAASANSVAWNNITRKPSSFTPSSHTHSISQVTGRGKLTFTGAAIGTYDGSGNLTINIPAGGGEADSVAWNNITGKPSTFTPSAHTHGTDNITALRGYSEGSATTTLSASMTLNAALASLQNQVQAKAALTHTHTASQVSGLADVATSGDYNDLSNKPTIPSLSGYATQTWVNGQIDAITPASIGAAKASHTHTASQVSGLSKVATSGSYNDLTNKPSIPAAVTVDSALSSTSTNPVQNKVINSALAGKAASSHTHSASDITSGKLALARIPTGTTSSTVALGNHTHSQYLTSSSLSEYTTTSEVNTLISSALSGYSKTDTKNTTGTSNSSLKLYLVGGASQSSSGVVTYSNSSVYMMSSELHATRMHTTNGFYETSDARLKNFKDDIKALDAVSEIPTKYFTWKSDESKTEHIGTSAQEIQKLYPDLVTENEDGVLSVDYARLSIIALAAIKELKAQIDELKSKIN